MKMLKYILSVWLLLVATAVSAHGEEGANEAEGEKFNPKEVIFEHLGDEYGWHVFKWSIPLPVIVCDEEGGWHVFSSARLQDGGEYEGFYIAAEGDYAHKVVGRRADGSEYRPWDFSITKNVFALILCALVLCWLIFPLVRWYKRKPMEAPRRVKGLIETLVDFLYKGVIVSVLGSHAKRYAPYLLTLFFFILIMNLMGLIVIFPGGANLTGNISITLVLALCTFVVVNVSGRKHYWKDVFWPEVPLWLKCPVPMMPVIEFFGVLTKPVSLMIRLFANMLGGHIIVLVLISLIFIMSALGNAAMGGTTVISVAFAVFMNTLHVLISFIQAYVFFMLSTIFIALAVPEEGGHEKAKKIK